MIVLGLDTSLQAASAALLADGEIVARRFARMERGHAEHLPLMAREVLREAGVSPGRLTCIGVTAGPGSFTGVRVGLAFARGLALGTEADGGTVPTVGVTSLAALAASVAPEGPVIVAIDARRGQIFHQAFDGAGAVLTPPAAAAPEAAGAALAGLGAGARLVGTGAAALAAFLPEAEIVSDAVQPDAAYVARLAATAPPPDGPPRPLYLRPPDAKPQTSSPLGAG